MPRYVFSTTLNNTRRTLLSLFALGTTCVVSAALFQMTTLQTTAKWDGDSIVVDWHSVVDVATSSFVCERLLSDPIRTSSRRLGLESLL
jgi:hypothetical protein